LGVARLGEFDFNSQMESRHPNLLKIGKRIAEIRKQKGFSQEAFAAEAEMGRTYIGRIERGEQNISIQNLIQIALTLKVQVGDLIPPLEELSTPLESYSNHRI
jgi:transcriptional regulator with XRE-family HTH domain